MPPVNPGPVAMTDTGATAIATNVVAKIAGIAAREVEGVHALVGSGAGDALSGLAQRVTGEDASERGVSVEVGQREAAVDLKLITVYGASIPDVAQAVRKNIIGRMQEMTGLIVTEVNIDVVDLYFPEDTHAAPEAARTAPRVA
ncbi:Asp23/Gls24 family envelope stress response protein [Chloroflexia bacterium SDU3-3]|nr:Asp23/Gls24 family envelope stress response protein [Chloroflexia bacterium SDU3-3]